MQITREDLRAFTALKDHISSLEKTIKTLYYNVGSPPTATIGTKSTEPSDPTQSAVFKILEEKEKLERQIEELDEFRHRIVIWSTTITDHTVASIIHLHYLQGYTWAETGKELGYSAGSCKRIIRDYFENMDRYDTF